MQPSTSTSRRPRHRVPARAFVSRSVLSPSPSLSALSTLAPVHPTPCQCKSCTHVRSLPSFSFSSLHNRVFDGPFLAATESEAAVRLLHGCHQGTGYRRLPARCSAAVCLVPSPLIILNMPSNQSRLCGLFKSGKKKKEPAKSASPQPTPPSNTSAASPKPVRMPQTCTWCTTPDPPGLDRYRGIASVAPRPWPLLFFFDQLFVTRHARFFLTPDLSVSDQTRSIARGWTRVNPGLMKSWSKKNSIATVLNLVDKCLDGCPIWGPKAVVSAVSESIETVKVRPATSVQRWLG
jgi:hypothetical protein